MSGEQVAGLPLLMLRKGEILQPYKRDSSRVVPFSVNSWSGSRSSNCSLMNVKAGAVTRNTHRIHKGASIQDVQRILGFLNFLPLSLSIIVKIYTDKFAAFFYPAPPPSVRTSYIYGSPIAEQFFSFGPSFPIYVSLSLSAGHIFRLHNCKTKGRTDTESAFG